MEPRDPSFGRSEPVEPEVGDVVLRSAFAVSAVIGVVFALIGLRALFLAVVPEGEQPVLARDAAVEPVPFDLRDSGGVPLATTVEYLELTASPTALWQAHTPERLVPLLAGTLDLPEAFLLERLMPDYDGRWVVAKGEPFPLGEDAAERVRQWLRSGRIGDGDEQGEPARGMQLVADQANGGWTLRWNPFELLSIAERRRQGLDERTSPVRWTMRLANDLSWCIHGQHLASGKAQDDFRNKLWAALMPTGHKVVLREVPPSQVEAVHRLLSEQAVQPHQMELVRHRKRAYPARTDGDALAVVGGWGVWEKGPAAEKARDSLGLPLDSATWSAQDKLDHEDLANALVHLPRPRSGLELAVERMLRGPEYATWVRRDGERYRSERRSAARTNGRAPGYQHFVSLEAADEPVQVETTLELPVQTTLRAQLLRTLEDKQPALAMGIVLDVQSGDVLALEAVNPYGYGGFAPLQHVFTPGSTMKAIVMASALHEGVVAPGEVFDAGHGKYAYNGRKINEAEGGDEWGRATATEGLAFSLNSVMVQIGTRLEGGVLERHFRDLGYGRAPGAGLSFERSGMVPALAKARNKTWSHASTCFGHEMHVTLWQHAAALATLLRGGHYRPLRLVRAVEQYGARREIPLVSDHPLQERDSLSAEACKQVREMMYVGAKIGTGKALRRDDMVMGTKTGTAQKVPGEICLHVELAHIKDHGCKGESACRATLRNQSAHPGKSCYTSSICMFGRLPGGGREVMVLYVVEEPRKGGRFGSTIAGPGALAVLREALGLTRGGVDSVLLDEEGFQVVQPQGELKQRISKGAHDHPWAEDTRATR
jgi:hypothetical protein